MKSRLIGKLVACWDVEMQVNYIVEQLLEDTRSKKQAAKLRDIAASGQGRASRILARLAALGGSPLTVPGEYEVTDPQEALKLAHKLLGCLEPAYTAAACLARDAQHPSEAWACELNRAECLDSTADILEHLMRKEHRDHE